MKPVTIAIVLALASTSSAQEWTRFRGPNGSGVVEGGRLPVRFGPGENLRWKAAVPFGASSPVLTKSAVVVTGSDDEHLIVTALDRTSGAQLWRQAIAREQKQEIYAANDPASPTPVTDGENVYAFFPELGLISFDADGKERWRHPLGPFMSFYGMSSSPLLARGLVVLLCDQQQGSFLVAVDAKTGKQRWKAERAGIIECWTTPVVYPADAPEEVIIFGSYYVTSYSLETGEELWRMTGFGYTPISSPILSGDHLYVSAPDGGELGLPTWEVLSGGTDADGDGRLARSEVPGEIGEHFGWIDVNRDDFIEEQEWDAAYDGMNSKDFGLAAIDLAGEKGPVELWRYKKALPSIASPLLYDGVLYLARDGGLVTRIVAENGEVLGRERIPDGMGECWPSPVAGDGKIYFATNSGQVAVVAADAEWKVLQTNDLGEDCVGSPAIAEDTLYVRTRSALWSFGELAPGE